MPPKRVLASKENGNGRDVGTKLTAKSDAPLENDAGDESSDEVQAKKMPLKKAAPKGKKVQEDEEQEKEVQPKGRKGKADTKDDDEPIAKKAKDEDNNESEEESRPAKAKGKQVKKQQAKEENVVVDEPRPRRAAAQRATENIIATGEKADDKKVIPKKGQGSRKAKEDAPEEKEADAVIVKKGRGKTTKEQDDEEDAAPKGRGRVTKGKQSQKKEEVDDEDEAEEVVPKGRGKAAAGKQTPKKGEDADENDEEEEVIVPKGRGKAATGKQTPKKGEDADEKDEEAEEIVPKGRGKTAAGKQTPKKGEDADEKDEEVAVPKGRGKIATRKQTPKKAEDADDVDKKVTVAKKGAGKARGKKAAAVDDEDEDGPSTSKKVKKEESDVDDDAGKSGGKSGVSMGKSIRRTVQVKGAAAVDALCPKAASAHVWVDGDLIYDTNVGNNNNKYYIMQLLEDDDKNVYSVWFRWGRVGYDGQNQLVPCGNNVQQAISVFGRKFTDKTRNDWPTTFDEFFTYPNKYTMIEMDYGGADDAQLNGVQKLEEEQEEEEKKCKVESKLDVRVQEVMQMICSIRAMQNTVKEMEFDAEKSPLGKLTQSQIKEGYACLKRIEEFINTKKFNSEWKMAVNEYYTKMIKTPQKLKAEIELLDVLSDIEYALKTMKEETKEDDVHPIDRHYQSMHCGLQAMDANEDDFKMVTEYLANTHGDTHHIQMVPTNVFKINRDGENENEDLMKSIGNRKLLWHGSRLSNFFGILSQGLRIAPPEAPCTGYMFGKGVYFADMASKSGNYCYPGATGQTGFLLLAEVALGKENRLLRADYDANRLPSGTNSTWGMGKTLPDPNYIKTMDDGTVVPYGKPVEHLDGKAGSLLYNEFIVYDTKQIRMRYLVEVEFKF